MSLPESKAFQIQTNKIQVQPDPISLQEKIQKESTHRPAIIESFNSTLFKGRRDKSTSQKKEKPALKWLFKRDIKEKREQIKGSRKSAFESYWKIDLDSFIWEADTGQKWVLRTRLNAKVLTEFTKEFFAKAEFELLTGTGTVQEIYQRTGEINGISQREVLFLWRATNWLTVEFGAINQSFLQSPLLLSDIPFPSIIGSIELYKEGKHDVSLSFQLATPNTFSTDNSISLQSIVDMPLLFTKSLFWYYDSKSFYNINFNASFFAYSSLPSDVAVSSLQRGNTVETGEPVFFKYQYDGFYLGVEPTFKVLPRLGLKLKAHYIINVNKEAREKNLNQGELWSVQIPFDITESVRVTPTLEYFNNQPDSAIAYYNSERYGHSNRKGFVGELIFNFYDRNLSTGFRYHTSQAVREGGLRGEQYYFLIFLRTDYAKI